MVKRSYYSNDIQSFLNQDNYSIFGEITTNDQFSAEDLQKNTWMDILYLNILFHE